MKCLNCDYEQSLKREVRNIKYDECGLDNVTLVGVEYHRCPNCGEEYFGYPKIDQLHSVIAKALILKKNPLRGNEFRFLRKYLGFSRDVFAKRIDRVSETISRYETGEREIPKDLDILMRSLVAIKTPDRDYDFHEIFVEHGSKKETKSLIKIKAVDSEWQLAS